MYYNAPMTRAEQRDPGGVMPQAPEHVGPRRGRWTMGWMLEGWRTSALQSSGKGHGHAAHLGARCGATPWRRGVTSGEW